MLFLLLSGVATTLGELLETSPNPQPQLFQQTELTVQSLFTIPSEKECHFRLNITWQRVQTNKQKQKQMVI